jgi:phosphatidate cytidylyltransferase
LAESLHGERLRPEESRSARTLGIRVLVGVLLIPIVLLINHAGGVVFALFVAAIAGMGSHEFHRMLARCDICPARAIGVAGSALVCFAFFLGVGTSVSILTVLVILILVERLMRQGRDGYIMDVGATIMGIVYTGWLLGYFILLRSLPSSAGGGSGDGTAHIGRSFVYLVLVLTWTYDTVAYVVGSFLGRRRIFSRISPSKTVEGTTAGIAGCLAAALISRATFADFLGWGHAVMIGLLLGVVAQIGDLVESMLKRSTGTKDSSHMIPGHGGVLDRFDSLLFTGPVLYFYVRIVLAWNKM